MKKKFLALSALIFAAVLSRLLPHPWNWTAVGATALLGGARFEKAWQAVLIPLLALGLSDLILGAHDVMPAVYGAIALTAVGARLFRAEIEGSRRVLAAVVASLVFFLITNFAVWTTGAFYSMDFNGLMACYAAGVPFLASQMLGDIFYVLVLFFVWDQATVRWPTLSKA